MDTGQDLLNWAMGPALQVATVIFVAGVIIRLLEIVLLGRKANLAPPKGNATVQGLKTILTRSIPTAEELREAPVVHFGGYVFHIGFFIALLFLAPHIVLFNDAFGISWPALSTNAVEISAGLAIVALIALLISRLLDPVRRMLANFSDYLVYILSLLPLVTGIMATYKIGGDYNTLLALHILSVEALMVAFPFTKLMHAFTFAISRYYNGALQGYKGAQS
jgi:nitrate reductase gamma subunit